MALHGHTPAERKKIRRKLPAKASTTAKSRAFGARGKAKRKDR